MYCTPCITIVVGAHPLIKGQLGVPMVFIVFSDGILGDNLPINTHYIGLISISADPVVPGGARQRSRALDVSVPGRAASAAAIPFPSYMVGSFGRACPAVGFRCFGC